MSTRRGRARTRAFAFGATILALTLCGSCESAGVTFHAGGDACTINGEPNCIYSVQWEHGGAFFSGDYATDGDGNLTLKPCEKIVKAFRKCMR